MHCAVVIVSRKALLHLCTTQATVSMGIKPMSPSIASSLFLTDICGHSDNTQLQYPVSSIRFV